MKITANKVATIHYTLKNDAGEIIDSSAGQAPLSYIQGKQNIIPGLEKALEGKSVGDKENAVIAPTEGYGEKNPALVQSVPKEMFKELGEVKVGMQFQVNTGEGGILLVTATEVNDTHVVVDGNHPLSGMTLHFEVEVLEVRDATEEELAHGHLHAGAGCCGGGENGEHCHTNSCCDDDDDDNGGCCMH